MARRRRKGRRKKTGMPSMASLAVAINGAQQFGLLPMAFTMLSGGGLESGIYQVTSRNQNTSQILSNVINTAVPAVAVKLARKYVGPVKAGPIRIL